MLMIRPHRLRIIGRSTALVQRKAPRRLVCSTSSQSSSLIRMMSPSRVTPALLTRMSIRPHASPAWVTIRSTPAVSRTSAWIVTAFRPRAVTSAAVSAAAAASPR
jgi:hypothetical protein